MATSPVLTETTRMTWMDAVRGTAILLLLLWHASAVPVLFGVHMPDMIRTVNAFFLPFRMPTLMLLSGMLLSRSLRKPLPQYLAGKFAMVLWPYFVWVAIAKLAYLDIAGMPWWHWRAWYAISYLWFLFFIGIYYAVAPLLRCLPDWLPMTLAATAGLLLDSGSMAQRLAYFAVFFFCGNWLSGSPGLIDRLTRPRVTVLLAVPTLALGAASVLRPERLHYLVWGAPLSIIGALVLVGIYTSAFRGGPLLRGLETLGRSSIVFYVSHFPVMALLSQSPVTTAGPVALATLNLAGALVVGALLARFKAIPPVRWLFQAPRLLSEAVAHVSASVLRIHPPLPATRSSEVGPSGQS